MSLDCEFTLFSRVVVYISTFVLANRTLFLQQKRFFLGRETRSSLEPGHINSSTFLSYLRMEFASG